MEKKRDIGYNVREGNEQCQHGQRQIDCLRADLTMAVLIGRSPRMREPKALEWCTAVQK